MTQDFKMYYWKRFYKTFENDDLKNLLFKKFDFLETHVTPTEKILLKNYTFVCIGPNILLTFLNP